jgi:hypothetical protein
MKNIFLTLAFSVFSLNTLALDINGEPYEFTGSISTITLTDDGGVINAVGETGQYGKVWLTYNLNLDNPATPNQGSFSGRAVAIDG